MRCLKPQKHFTTSWMALSAVTISVFTYLLAQSLVTFAAPRQEYPDLLEQASKQCREKLESFRFMESFVGDEPDLSHWKTDAILELALQLEREYLPKCKKPDFSRDVLYLKGHYLERVGIKGIPYSRKDKDLLFKALISPQTSHNSFIREIKKLPRSQTLSGSTLVRSLFGETAYLYKVLVLSEKPFAKGMIQDLLKDVCLNKFPCQFWDHRVLYKMVVIKQKGTAAYVPELGTLLVDESLLKKNTKYHKTVLLHELAHVATQVAKFQKGKDWLEDFQKFSNWKFKKRRWIASVEAQEVHWSDRLARAASKSPFSLGKDVVVSGKEGNDGFVTAKSWRSSIDNQDPSEDLADHIAIFRYFPNRFCFRGKPLAGQKFNWVANNVFPLVPTEVNCNIPRSTASVAEPVAEEKTEKVVEEKESKKESDSEAISGTEESDSKETKAKKSSKEEKE